MIPSRVGAVRLIVGMALRRARRGKLLWAIVAIAALLLASAVVSVAVGRAGLEFYDRVLDATLRYVVPLVMLILCSSAVSEEVQGKTITYLFARPIPRWALPLGRYLAGAALAIVVLVPATAASYFVTMLGEADALLPEASRLAQGLLAVGLSVLVFGAIAVAFGTMVTGYSFVVALFFFLVVEVGLSQAPGWIKVMIMTEHLRVVAGLYLPGEAAPAIPIVASVPVLLVAAALWLLVACSWVSQAEYRTDS